MILLHRVETRVGILAMRIPEVIQDQVVIPKTQRSIGIFKFKTTCEKDLFFPRYSKNIGIKTRRQKGEYIDG